MKIFKLKYGNKIDSSSIETHGKVWSTEDYTTAEKKKLSNPTAAKYFFDTSDGNAFYWHGEYTRSSTVYNTENGRVYFSNLNNLAKVGFYALNSYNLSDTQLSNINFPDSTSDVGFMIVYNYDNQIRQIYFNINGTYIRRYLGSSWSAWGKI